MNHSLRNPLNFRILSETLNISIISQIKSKKKIDEDELLVTYAVS